jgi:hypothetical protein
MSLMFTIDKPSPRREQDAWLRSMPNAIWRVLEFTSCGQVLGGLLFQS